MKRCLFSALLLVLLLTGCVSQTVTPADKTAVLTIKDLSDFGYANPKPPAGKWNKTGYGDGSYEVEYEVETPDSEQKFPLYLSETLSNEKNAAEARSFLAATRGAQSLAFKAQSISEVSVPKQTIYGDGSSLTVLQDGKIPIGNVFSARKKGRSFFLVMTGVVFEDPQDWDDFAGKKIRAWLDNAS